MSSNSKGILWALVATALFALSSAMSKIAVADYHVLQILFIRQIVVFFSVLPSIAKSFPENLKTDYPCIHILRLSGAFVALSMGIWAVAVLPLTTATVLAFSQVFFGTLLAMKFLREPIGNHRILAVVIGFIGVIIVIQPKLGGFIETKSFIAILAAFGAAVAITSVRKLSQTENTATLLAYQAIFVGLMSGIPMFWLWITPDFLALILMLGIGVVSTIAQWIGIKALRAGEASVIASIEYMKLIYAAILGYLLFLEIPSASTLVGAVVIISSAFYTLRRESRI